MHGHLPGQAQQAAQRPGAAHCARLLQHLQAAFGQRVCGLPMGDLHLCLLQLLLRRAQRLLILSMARNGTLEALGLLFQLHLAHVQLRPGRL